MKSQVDKVSSAFWSGGIANPGVRVEVTTRTWGWEIDYSARNQVGSVKFPSPAFAVFHAGRSVCGSADLLDTNGYVATVFRRAPGAGCGSAYLYVRKDLLDSYISARSLRLVTVIGGERTLHHDHFAGPLPADLRKVYQSQVRDFVTVVGLR